MFRLDEQARSILVALKNVPELAGVAWLDDDQMLAAAPARMPAVWLTLERLELAGTGVPAGMGVIVWAVALKVKRLREKTDGRPALIITDAILNCLHGLRGPAAWARPLCFSRLECLELQSEAAAYILHFTTQVYLLQTPRHVGAAYQQIK